MKALLVATGVVIVLLVQTAMAGTFKALPSMDERSLDASGAKGVEAGLFKFNVEARGNSGHR